MFARGHLNIIIIIIMYYSSSPIKSVGVLAPICLSVSSMQGQPGGNQNAQKSSSRGWDGNGGWGDGWGAAEQAWDGQWDAADGQWTVKPGTVNGWGWVPQVPPAPALPLPPQPARPPPPLLPAQPLQVAAAHALAPWPLPTAATPPPHAAVASGNLKKVWDDRKSTCENLKCTITTRRSRAREPQKSVG